MFSSGIGIAALGALVAGQLPGWLRHLSDSITATQASRWTLEFACGAAALSMVPLLQLRLPAAAPRVRLSRLSNPFLRRFLPAMAVWALVTGSFPPFANVYFVHHLGLSLQKVGFVFSLSQLVQFLAVLCAPLLFRRTGLVRGVVLTQIATAAALASLAFIHGGTLAVWVYPVYMAIQYMNEPGIFSLLMDQIPPGERSNASASTFFVTSACQAIASAIMGVAIVRFGYPAVLLAIAGLAIIGHDAVWKAVRPPRHCSCCFRPDGKFDRYPQVKMSLLCHFVFSLFICLLPDGHCIESGFCRMIRPEEGLSRGVSMSLILVIEDDPRIQRALRRQFSAEGYDVHIEGEGPSGLAACKNLRPVTVVLDLMLPGPFRPYRLQGDQGLVFRHPGHCAQRRL